MDLFIAIEHNLLGHSIQEMMKDKDFVDRVVAIRTLNKIRTYLPIRNPSVLLVDSWKIQKNKAAFSRLVSNVMDESLGIMILNTNPGDHRDDYKVFNVYGYIPFKATFDVMEKKLRRYTLTHPGDTIPGIQKELSEASVVELSERTGLEKREIQILYLVCNDFSSTEISKLIHLKKKTVERYRHGINKKLGCTSAMECARYAFRHNLFPDL